MSASPPIEICLKTRLRSAGSGGRAGSHSQRARMAASSALTTVRALGVVRVGAARPGAVGELVVIEGGDHREGGVHRLDVGVAVVLGVAGAVLLEGAALPERIEVAADVGAGRLSLRGDVGSLVDVVAQVEEKVEILSLGDPRVGVEVAGVELGARADREADPLGVASGERPRPGHRRGLAVDRESVEVDAVGLEVLDLDHDGVIALGASDRRPGADGLSQRGVARDRPLDRDVGVAPTDTRPDRDAVGGRVATGDPVSEGRITHGDGRYRARTSDLLGVNEALSQLS